ncbi:MAG: FAD-dependent oxidoreductase, partial [Magnetococcales bacterium]|nr:FAD-dependent oxidoreductase [Magnetococcales bacterium]
IDADKYYYSCPLSNWVIAGFRELEAQKWSWDAASKAHGYTHIQDTVVNIDAKAKQVQLKSGSKIGYDRCIVAPGVDYKWNSIEGYNEQVSNGPMPHAWKAGPQTQLLADQLKAMPDGGVVVISPPKNPFRCPPGPYERASLIAWYLQKHKPKSKVLILDPKPKFSKYGLFTGGWKELYGYETENSLIQWEPESAVTEVDPKNMTVTTEMDTIKGAVVNIIPNQTAGFIAHTAGLTGGKDWCPVNKKTFESTIHAGVHVIGDAASAAKMPKSGYAANSQAKVCAAAVVDMINGRAPGKASYVNTCYSMLSPHYGISVAAIYKLKGKVISKVGGGLSPTKASAAVRKQEGEFNESWYQSIMRDGFA